MSDLYTAPIHTFIRFDEEPYGAVAIARFYPYDQYPIFFSGDTEAEAHQRAIDWREGQRVANEKAIEQRKANMAKAREAKLKKVKND